MPLGKGQIDLIESKRAEEDSELQNEESPRRVDILLQLFVSKTVPHLPNPFLVQFSTSVDITPSPA